MHWPRDQKIKGQGHTVTKTVTVARDACCYGRVLQLPAWVYMSIRLSMFSYLLCNPELTAHCCDWQRRILGWGSVVRRACRPCWRATSRWLSSATWNAFCLSTAAGPTCECASFLSTFSTRTSPLRSVTSGTRSTAASLLRSEHRHYFCILTIVTTYA